MRGSLGVKPSLQLPVYRQVEIEHYITAADLPNGRQGFGVRLPTRSLQGLFIYMERPFFLGSEAVRGSLGVKPSLQIYLDLQSLTDLVGLNTFAGLSVSCTSI